MRDLNSNAFADTFWEFSISLYQHDKVQALCLRLQDEYKFNVNLLLLCCFLSEKGIFLSNADAQQLIQSVQAAERPLLEKREQRKAAKAGPATRYQMLKDEELILEREQQRLIAETVKSFMRNLPLVANSPKSGLTNLMAYATNIEAKASHIEHEVRQLILDLSIQHQAFTQLTHHAK